VGESFIIKENMENYNARDIECILDAISYDPVGFRKLCHSLKISVTDNEIVRSMSAWGIDPYATQNHVYRSNRRPR
jgi:hypothetical protein